MNDHPVREIVFSPGYPFIKVRGYIAHGEEDQWHLRMSPLQTLMLRTDSLGDNAVLHVYAGARDVSYVSSGAAVPLTPQGGGIMGWTGMLPDGVGEHILIVVGTTRGEARYDLTVSIT